MGAPKQKWTSEEEDALRRGVLKHGAGKWRTIQKDPEFSPVLSSRSNIDLKVPSPATLPPLLLYPAAMELPARVLQILNPRILCSWVLTRAYGARDVSCVVWFLSVWCFSPASRPLCLLCGSSRMLGSSPGAVSSVADLRHRRRDFGFWELINVSEGWNGGPLLRFPIGCCDVILCPRTMMLWGWR